MKKGLVSPRTIPDMERLLNSYGDDILRLCYLYLNDMQLAEDAVQETYIKVYKNWYQFKGEASEKTWITKIAINTCNSMRKSKWFQVSRQAVSLDDSVKSYAEQQMDDTVMQAIYRLKPKYREVIILFYYEEMKGKEIAKCLGIGESTVSVRLSRARAILKQSLKGWYFNE